MFVIFLLHVYFMKICFLESFVYYRIMNSLLPTKIKWISITLRINLFLKLNFLSNFYHLSYILHICMYIFFQRLSIFFLMYDLFQNIATQQKKIENKLLRITERLLLAFIFFNYSQEYIWYNFQHILSWKVFSFQFLQNIY